MYIEYACYDHSLLEDEVKENIINALKLGIKHISTYQYSLSQVKSIIDSTDPNISLSCPADYPYGLSDLKSRNHIVSQIAKVGVSTIDLVMPSKFVTNRKYDKIREDIKSNLEICQNNNTNLRYILEYRVFNHEILAKICQILKTMDIHQIIPSTGQMIDDINDNIIASKYLQVKSGINPIVNGNIWTQKQADTVVGAGVTDLRLHHLSSLYFFMKNSIG